MITSDNTERRDVILDGIKTDYLVNAKGQVYSKISNKILKASKCNTGYLSIGIHYLGKCYKSVKIHRLVAETFIPNPENKPQINHIDGNKQNNRIDNLEWCTNSENQIHACKLGLKASVKGNKNPNCKKINQYDLDGNFIKQWNSFYDIKKYLNIDRTLIWKCCIGKFKQIHGYVWEYANKNNSN
jgi:hypothetical protein